MQPRFFIGILVLQSERLVHAFFQTGILRIGQFSPARIFSRPNDMAFFVGQLARDADLVGVIVQNLFRLRFVCRLEDLCQGFIASLFGIDVGVTTLFRIFLQQSAAFP